jgi:hypothetical protein
MSCHRKVSGKEIRYATSCTFSGTVNGPIHLRKNFFPSKFFGLADLGRGRQPKATAELGSTISFQVHSSVWQPCPQQTLAMAANPKRQRSLAVQFLSKYTHRSGRPCPQLTKHAWPRPPTPSDSGALRLSTYVEGVCIRLLPTRSRY